MFHTSSSWFLLLLLLVPLIVWRMLATRKRSAVMFSSTGMIRHIRPSWKQRLWWLPPALRVGAIVLLIVAMARPQEGRKQTVVDSEGIAIEMVVDRSGSMQAMDFQVDGEAVDRLTAVKDVAAKFIDGGDGLEGRSNDLLGLISFAGYADSLGPPTLDHAYVIGRLDDTQIVTERSEDGTAIGDAIGLAIEKLNTLDHDANRKMKSKIVILLTDGENNAGEVEPIQAAELAETMGIKIYTIGVGTKGRAPVPVVDPWGRRTMQWMDVNIDEATLKKVAEATGGKYFRATDTASLENIYKEIDQLEKSRIEERHYVDYRELAIEPVQAGAFTLPPLVLVALLMLAGQVVLSNSVFRQVP